jgi:hypothetical protein
LPFRKETALGLAIGIPVALLCVRYVKTLLYEITAPTPI